jgi:hypothetical protein
MVIVKGSVEVKILSPHSDKHFRCACLCAKWCKAIEGTFDPSKTWEEQSLRCQDDWAYATGVVISSSAFLEAKINEFFSDCNNKAGQYSNFSVLGDLVIKNLTDYWNKTNKRDRYINRYLPTLDKYRDAYKIIKGKGSHYPAKSYDEIQNLVNLRNILIHYEPLWQTTDPIYDDPYKLEVLQDRFDLNPFQKNSGMPFFPHKCLGYGCALWALNSCRKFVGEFYNEINVKPNLHFEEVWKEIFQ